MKKKIAIEGMGCGSCVGHIKEALGIIKGIKSIEVNLAEKNAVVELTQDVSDDMIIATVNDAGYTAVEVVTL